MGQNIGELKDGELWIRCPSCGDSKRSATKAHLSVNVARGVFHCVRCGYSGALSPRQLFDLAARYDSIFGYFTKRTREPAVVKPGGSSRFSALDRWSHIDDDGEVWDVFESKDPQHNEPIGQYFRKGSDSLFSGEKGLGWPGVDQLISSPAHPLRIVEGPYDVLDKSDVCCFGFITTHCLRRLRGHFVIICPDGDVWEDPLLKEKIVRVMRWCFIDQRAPYILGLEMLPDGKDPDECPVADRLFVQRDQLLRRLTVKRSTLIARS